MDFEKGEVVEWTIETKKRLTLKRTGKYGWKGRRKK
jgi:hypothetical protein